MQAHLSGWSAVHLHLYFILLWLLHDTHLCHFNLHSSWLLAKRHTSMSFQSEFLSIVTRYFNLRLLCLLHDTHLCHFNLRLLRLLHDTHLRHFNLHLYSMFLWMLPIHFLCRFNRQIYFMFLWLLQTHFCVISVCTCLSSRSLVVKGGC